jgi:flagellar hook-associated protein 1 FlgK
MPDPILGSGLSGLLAAQAGLATTSHNISNASTPGYSRQGIVQGTQVAQFTGAGYIGRGTVVETVRRSYSDFLEVQARQSTAGQAHADAYLNIAARLDDLLASDAASLSPAVDEFFGGLNEVAAKPGDVAARQSLLSSAEALVGRFRTLDAQISAARTDINERLESAVAGVNSVAVRIADLNDRIVAARGTGSRIQEPNDLLDQRDALVRELSGLVRATVVPQDDGSYNVFIGSGQALVVRDQANRLATVPGLEDPAELGVGVQGSGGATLRFRPQDLAGGEIGGLLAVRGELLDGAQNALGRIAIGLAQAVNDQHRLGQDLTGALGQAFFSFTGPQVLPNTGNAGTATLTATLANTSNLTTSDYRVRWTGAAYSVTRLSDNTAQSFATLPATIDGVTLAVSGTPAANDSFLVQPTRAGARDLATLVTDTSRVAAASPIRTGSAVANRGTASISPGAVVGPPPTNANLTQAVTITFTSAGTFNVTGTGTGNPTGVAYTAGSTIAFNGWSVAISGAPQAGDVFTIAPNATGTGDNRNALALAKVQTAALLAGGTATAQGAYAQVVSDAGNRTRQAQVTSTAQAKLLETTLAERESVSGVNLDEEAANLLRYQQAYQAAAKVIAMSATLFESILAIGR